MKTKSLSLLLAFVACPIFLFASADTDRKIEDAARASYNYKTVLNNNVKVKVTDGVATLTGTVQDQDEKTLARDTVENLPGVTSVRNDIVVKSDHPEKSDGWVALKIRSRLLVKGNVSAATTKVEVKDGHAMLTGTADTLAQKELTGIYAQEIEGVKTVKNDITVTNKVTMSEKIDDASITSQLKYALLSHKATSALKTKVTTNDGVVAITGEASSDDEKALVTKLASDVRGVKSVSNDMVVRKS